MVCGLDSFDETINRAFIIVLLKGVPIIETFRLHFLSFTCVKDQNSQVAVEP